MQRKSVILTLSCLTLFVGGIFSVLQSTSFTTPTGTYYQMQPIYSEGDPLPQPHQNVTLSIPQTPVQDVKPVQKLASNNPINIIPQFVTVGTKNFTQTYIITAEGDYVSPAPTQYVTYQTPVKNIAYQAPIRGNGAVMFRPVTTPQNNTISSAQNIVVSSAR